MVIEYRSIADMNEAILRNLHKLPHDIDFVVGIPRSGMLPANLIALYLNKPYTDIDSFIEGRLYGTGERGVFIKKETSNKVLVVDDSIYGGNALTKAQAKLANMNKEGNYEFIYGVVFAMTKIVDRVDFYCEIIDEKRIFQWNLFHHDFFIPHAFCDIDGVLCPNPPIDDDGEQYKKYISTAPVLYKPSLAVDTLISCRLEKYRDITEKWLADNGIEYKRLILLNLPTKEERINWGKHGIYKGEAYRDSDCCLFIESSLYEAREIVKISHKPVFCTETFTMINEEQVVLKNEIRKRFCKLFLLVDTIRNWKRLG